MKLVYDISGGEDKTVALILTGHGAHLSNVAKRDMALRLSFELTNAAFGLTKLHDEDETQQVFILSESACLFGVRNLSNVSQTVYLK